MTGPTLDSVPQGSLRPDGWPSRNAWAPWRVALCAGLAAFLLACGGGSGGGSEDGGGGGGGGSEPPLATEPVDLPPGETVAQLAWEPSEGRIATYMVFVSRNRGSFDYDQGVFEPMAQVEGAPGDEVRITVVAVNTDGDVSGASPPSVPIRFHAPAGDAQGAGVAPVASALVGGSDPGDAVDAGDAGPEPTPVADAALPPPAADLPGADPLPPVADAPSEPAPEPEPTTTPEIPPSDATGDPSGLTPALRARLLAMDVRRPLAGLGEAAALWIQAWVEGEVGSGLSLIATAAGGSDAVADLVWQDPSGQLWLSDGAQFAEATDPGTTLVPALQLLEGERFVDLVDLDGDGVRDWLVEDEATGAAWFRTNEASPPLPARSADQPETARLLGSGDFDGDGRAELLWQHEDGSLSLARPGDSEPAILAGAVAPVGSRIVAVADLTGDGRDDLIARSEDGQLALGLAAAATEGGIELEWSEGHAEADASAELMATLDLDGDGRSELAWLIGGAVEIRAIGETTPRTFEF